jgi:transposase
MSDRQLWNNRVNKAQKYTVTDFNREFPNDDACLESIKEQRFPGGVTKCETCDMDRKHYRVTGRTAYACDHCGHHIYPLAGTIFEKSTTSLYLWFYAMYLMSATKCGISAKQIQRETGVTYKTAWRMFRQIRALMSEEISLEGSSVEMDEAYHGGNRKGKSGRPGVGDKKKIPIVGMAERGTPEKSGRVVARVAVDTKQETLHGLVREYVLPKSTVYTDEYSSYKGLHAIGDFGKDEQGKLEYKPRGYEHRRINHSSGVYVNGDVHTNTIEGFWSLIKRGIGGTHHAVSQKFLQSYLDEYSFRYNRRDVPRPMFKQLLDQVSERAQ